MPALTIFAVSRAREGRADYPQALMPTRPAPGGCAALRLVADVDIIFLVELLVAGSAADDGARVIGAIDDDGCGGAGDGAGAG